MDSLLELENMVSNAAFSHEISEDDLERWQRLFNVSSAEAATAIANHRSNLSRQRISDELWKILGPEFDAQGYDREAYEYSLTLPERPKASPSTSQAVVPNGTFIVKLDGPLDSPKKVQEVALLPTAPPTSRGTDEDDNVDATFCELDALGRHRLLLWVAQYHPTFRPTIVRLAKAKKELCKSSIAPFLGIDTTLPQYRPNTEAGPTVKPSQEQYPVWYFFYGTLAKLEVLSQHLDLRAAESRELQPACALGGRIRTWGGKYRALVDDPTSVVEGSAFLVQSKDEEDALRFYESDRYEVVRCRILFDKARDGSACALTFRFAGDERELD